MKRTIKIFILAFGLVPIIMVCTNSHKEQSTQPQFIPGLGEFMSQSATAHAKLWFAGRANNWELADYEIDELREALEDAGKFHHSDKQTSQPIPDLIAQSMYQPLAQLEQAIKDKNAQSFTESYDNLTTACNNCHQTTGFGFNLLTRPSFNTFSNQAFGKTNADTH